MNTPTTAWFALHDSAFENGSFIVIRRTMEFGTYFATYMNGDHMGSEHLAKSGRGKLAVDAAARKARELVEAGLREYSAAEFKKLAPKCVGGKGWICSS